VGNRRVAVVGDRHEDGIQLLGSGPNVLRSVEVHTIDVVLPRLPPIWKLVRRLRSQKDSVKPPRGVLVALVRAAGVGADRSVFKSVASTGVNSAESCSRRCS
jgi:hypothetical protein